MPISKDDVSAPAADLGRDVARELAFRRSLRGSRARRAAGTLRRRRALRSRGSAFVVMAGLVMLSAAATASTGGAAPKPLGKATISAAQRALGIKADGVMGPATRRATKRFQRKHDLEPDGLLGPRTLKALGVDPEDPQAASASLDPRLKSIAQCESGGDPTAVSPNGLYFGKYQFSRATWRSVGGRGNPAKAPEAEQDSRAAKLLARAGTAPWPNCA